MQPDKTNNNMIPNLLNLKLQNLEREHFVIQERSIEEEMGSNWSNESSDWSDESERHQKSKKSKRSKKSHNEGSRHVITRNLTQNVEQSFSKPNFTGEQ